MTRPKPVRTRWFKNDRRAKLGDARAALESALVGRDLSGSALITVELARAAADLVDSSRRAQEPRLWLTASARLLALVGQLGLDGTPAVSGDGGAAGAGAEPDDAGGLAGVLGAGPTMGDAEDT